MRYEVEPPRATARERDRLRLTREVPRASSVQLGAIVVAFGAAALILAILHALAGCYSDARTFPTPLGGPWGSGHCSPMFAAEVMGCTSWWCSGREPRR